jgi:hypothetical protein
MRSTFPKINCSWIEIRMTNLQQRHQLETEIAAAHAAVVAAESQALVHARRCGDLLIQAKRRIGHGHWMRVVKACGMSPRTAAIYMSLSSRWPEIENSSAAATLSLRDALRLLKPVRTRRDPPVPRVHWKHLTADERREVRRIAVEMDQFRFVARTFNERPKSSGFDIVYRPTPVSADDARRRRRL